MGRVGVDLCAKAVEAAWNDPEFLAEQRRICVTGCALAWLLLLLSMMAHVAHDCGCDEGDSDDDEPTSSMYTFLKNAQIHLNTTAITSIPGYKITTPLVCPA